MSLSKLIRNSKYLLTIFGCELSTAVHKFTVEERISGVYEINLWIVSEDKIHFNDVIQNEALLTIVGTEPRYFRGVMNHFMLSGRGGRFYFYQATMVPNLWFLSLGKDFRIFQDMTTEEIVKKVLEENHILSDCYKFRLAKDYQKRRYCTQYGESDFHFTSRLLEEEGIFYFFEHSKDKHLLVFADDTAAYLDISGEKTIHMHHDAGMVAEKEVIDGFSYLRSICPGTVTQTNYNFKRPSLNLKTEKQGRTHENYEVYEYPGAFGYPDEANRTAQVRLEENKALEQLAQGSSNCGRFTPGYIFTMSCHEFDDLNKDYLLVSVKHQGLQSHVTGEYSGIGGDSSYTNEFLVIPASVTFRPDKSFRKPIVYGPQSAVVVGPKGEEIYVDEFCRVKVQFPWDRKGRNDEKSSCWVRVLQTWGGGGWGSVFIPRVGDEVLIDFQNGDPDWPILVGSVYNGKNKPLYDLKNNKTRTVIKTRSYPKGGPDNYNELRFEDKKGTEEVYLQAEKDYNVLVKNNRTETVYVNKAETIGVAKELTIGAGYQVNVGGAMNESVALAKAEEVGLNRVEAVGVDNLIKVGSNYSLDVGEKCVITADTSITLICGSSTITLEPQLITINSPLVKINT